MPDNEAPSPASPQSTSLRLLAKDAIVQVTFAALLSSEQYAELLEVASRAETFDEISAELNELGRRWAVGTSVSRVKPSRLH